MYSIHVADSHNAHYPLTGVDLYSRQVVAYLHPLMADIDLQSAHFAAYQ